MLTQGDKKLFLLDAMALIYRAHFAFSKNPRINSRGLNTGVMLGFTNTLLEVLEKEKPTHIAVAFDTRPPPFRHTRLDTDKPNRQEQPEDIEIAIPWIKQIVAAFNIPLLELDGYEADDIIGTIAKKAEYKDFTVYMMTPAKDFGQLVEEHIFLYKPAYMGNKVDVMGPKEVCEKWGIRDPDQVRDILGLMGDAVDNIPGIPGIGAKTATSLLKEYGTIEELVKNTHQLKGKQKENVEKFAQQGLLSKDLATIMQTVPIDYNPQEYEYVGPDEETLKALFAELEFRALTQRVFKEGIKRPKIQVSEQLGLFTGQEVEQEVGLAIDDAPLPSPAIMDTILTTLHDYHKIEGEAA